MFSKFNSRLFRSCTPFSTKNFSTFTAAKLNHIYVPCKNAAITDAPNLIALHGVLGSGMNFNQIMNKDAISSKVNSYLLDLRNHGKSEHRESMSYPEMAKDVHQFIMDNGLEKKNNIILGFSMGSRVAAEVAVTYPEIAKGFVIVDLAPHDYTSDRRFTFVDAMDKTLAKLCQIDLSQDRSKIRQDIMSVSFSQDAGEAINANIVPNGNGGFKWRLNVHSIANNFKSQIINARYTGYDTYNGPVKLILGGQSEYTSKDLIPSFHQMFENFNEDKDVSVVDKSGHWVYYNQPAQFTNLMSQYIDEIVHA